MNRLRKVFKRIRYMLAAMAAGTALWGFAPEARAMDEIMPLEEVEAGMTGELFTVADASGEIRSFEVTILGVMRNGKSMPYIIARSEGAFADTDGGLMQGMSGSPVYVDGRLVGAGSATVKEMDPHTFLVTPIEEMLPLWDMPDTKNQTRPRLVDLKKTAEEKAKEEGKDAKAEENGQKTETDKAGKDAKGKEEPKDEAKKPAASVKDTETKKETPAEPKKEPEAQKEKDADPAKEPEAKKEKDADPAKEPEAKKEAQNADKQETKKDERPKPDTRKKAEAENREEDEDEGETTKDGAGVQEKSLFYAGGFGEPGMRFLEKQLAPLGLTASSFGGLSGASYTTDYEAELYPGSPVGAALAYGDFSFAATGTVTAVEEDGRILAFGHPFLHRGNVNYFMTDASVFAMVNGMTDGMKLVNTGSIIGRISQDRTAGIAGTVGMFPSVVPIRLTVEDKTLSKTSSYAATMAYDEAFVPVLTQAIAYAALGRTVDNMSESTVKVDFAIRTDAAEDGVFKRTNLFYAAADTGQIAFAELAQALALISGDMKDEAGLYDIKVNIVSEAERRTASLVSATPDKPTVKPGETVNFKVTLQPYRSQTVTVDVPFTVPKTQRDGVMHLDVHGGGLVSLEKLLAAAQSEMGVVTSDNQEQSKTAKERLHDLGETDSNHEIVIEPGPGPVLSEKEQKKEIEAAIRWQEEMQASGQKVEPDKPPKAKFATDYVIDNVIHTTVEVSRKEE
ncbi:MAG: SpoIVB peptidase S55 domain protein [Schwartzia sp.]|nr:SpoIVB peptidase S55 domain protein [Schwartzia sp. (in: firmicutes)]